ncbi:DUF2808 domain-containing protein [Chroococcus sp. FPU101]|uniref:DUF2808 domain-containing protein n=1 Tax=Chroococcus sp. FPU101 TaxID=1974212 RepID=UPI001A8EC5A8|nr:DUF2808 domain-containing protein [Chroococcus sp. FPU101]GFE69137.1 hypothetical protein CFPU101_17470 [Chroococcus sp. FPU101]
MRLLSLLTLTLCVSNLVSTPLALTQELPYPANSTFFTGEPPILVGVETPDDLVGWRLPHYYFTVNVPASSPESLGKVTIAPEVSGFAITFDLSKTQAFQGTKKEKGQAITLQSVTQDPKTQMITIAFTPPISPGTTFTIDLRAYNNPPEGTYLFQVQGFPAGDNPIGLDLGVGRLSFDQVF